jgi:hypothetical protein
VAQKLWADGEQRRLPRKSGKRYVGPV